MSTRGVYGFRINGTDKVMYNHFDSYLEGLGVNILNFIKNTNDDELKKIAENIELISEDSKPTDEQIKYVKDFEKEHKMKIINIFVSEQTVEDCYCLLRELQGNLKPYKKGFKFMLD